MIAPSSVWSTSIEITFAQIPRYLKPYIYMARSFSIYFHHYITIQLSANQMTKPGPSIEFYKGALVCTKLYVLGN